MTEHTHKSPDEIQDHILVHAWLEQESGETHRDHCLEQVEPHLRDDLARELMQKEWIHHNNGSVSLTAAGEARARTLIRRHRLAECLFSVVFQLPESVVHEQACIMEHERSLTPEAVEGICAFLGHPPTCPHGKAIPSGECCKLVVNNVAPLVTPLVTGEVGQIYKIVFIAPKYHALLERLSGLGVIPGAHLRLSQKSPSYLLKVQETEVALDKEIAQGIYVVPQAN